MPLRALLIALLLLPGATPLVMYTLQAWVLARQIAAQSTGSINADFGLIAHAGYKIGGLWDEPWYWRDGPLDDLFGPALALSPVGWGWCVLAMTLALAFAMVASLWRCPGIIPHRQSLRGWASQSPDNRRTFTAALALIARRVVVVWLALAPIAAGALAIWFTLGEGGEALGSQWRVLILTLVVSGVALALSVYAGARWARREVLRMCSACANCGYPRPAASAAATETACTECGTRADGRPRRVLPRALRSGIIAACVIMPWLALGWMTFRPVHVGMVWLPYDSAHVIRLASGIDVLIEARLEKFTPSPVGTHSYEVVFVVDLRAPESPHTSVGTLRRTVKHHGNPGMPIDNSGLMDIPVTDPRAVVWNSEFRLYSAMASEKCVSINVPSVVRITRIKDE